MSPKFCRKIKHICHNFLGFAVRLVRRCLCLKCSKQKAAAPEDWPATGWKSHPNMWPGIDILHPLLHISKCMKFSGQQPEQRCVFCRDRPKRAGFFRIRDLLAHLATGECVGRRAECPKFAGTSLCASSARMIAHWKQCGGTLAPGTQGSCRMCAAVIRGFGANYNCIGYDQTGYILDNKFAEIDTQDQPDTVDLDALIQEPTIWDIVNGP